MAASADFAARVAGVRRFVVLFWAACFVGSSVIFVLVNPAPYLWPVVSLAALPALLVFVLIYAQLWENACVAWYEQAFGGDVERLASTYASHELAPAVDLIPTHRRRALIMLRARHPALPLRALDELATRPVAGAEPDGVKKVADAPAVDIPLGRLGSWLKSKSTRQLIAVRNGTMIVGSVLLVGSFGVLVPVAVLSPGPFAQTLPAWPLLWWILVASGVAVLAMRASAITPALVSAAAASR